jgi:sec-independent protein translocase protein TatB
MMGIGPMEIVVILVVTLLVVGPEKMPELARSIVRLMRDVRRMMDDARGQIEEITREELLNKKDVDSYYRDVVDTVKKAIDAPDIDAIGREINREMEKAVQQLEKEPEEPPKPENPPAQPSP